MTSRKDTDEDIRKLIEAVLEADKATGTALGQTRYNLHHYYSGSVSRDRVDRLFDELTKDHA